MIISELLRVYFCLNCRLKGAKVKKVKATFVVWLRVVGFRTLPYQRISTPIPYNVYPSLFTLCLDWNVLCYLHLRLYMPLFALEMGQDCVLFFLACNLSKNAVIVKSWRFIWCHVNVDSCYHYLICWYVVMIWLMIWLCWLMIYYAVVNCWHWNSFILVWLMIWLCIVIDDILLSLIAVVMFVSVDVILTLIAVVDCW